MQTTKVPDCTHEVGPHGPHGVKLINVDCSTRRELEKALEIVGPDEDRTTQFKALIRLASFGIIMSKADPESYGAFMERRNKAQIDRVFGPGAEVRK